MNAPNASTAGPFPELRPRGRAHHTTEWAAPELGKRRLCAEGAAWLARVPWQALASLTFATVPTERAALAFVRAWLGAIASCVGAHVEYAFGAALDDAAAPHFHVLLTLAPARMLSARELCLIDRMWRTRHGFARVQRCEPGGGAERYALAHPTWDRGVICPEPRAPRCRRGRGCPEVRRRW